MDREMNGRNREKRVHVPELTMGEAVREVALPFVGFGVVAGMMWAGTWCGVAAATVVGFALCIRLAHDLHHHALRLNRGVNDVLLTVLSPMILSSMHAARRAHVAHHRDPMGEDDLEGESGRLGFWGALAVGAVAVPRLHVKAVRDARAWERGVILAETGLALAAVGVWVWAATLWPVVWVYLGVMAGAHAFSPMVAVWAVHRGSGDGGAVSRTQESRVFHLLTMGLLYHLEHHRYPGVPTCRLHLVAREMRVRGEGREQILPTLSGGRGYGDPGAGCGGRGYFRGLEA